MRDIVGLHRGPSRIDWRAFSRANQLQRHRGRDASGCLPWRRPDLLVPCGDANTVSCLRLARLGSRMEEAFDLAPGSRRLVIQNLSSRSHQSVGTANGRTWLLTTLTQGGGSLHGRMPPGAAGFDRETGLWRALMVLLWAQGVDVGLPGPVPPAAGEQGPTVDRIPLDPR